MFLTIVFLSVNIVLYSSKFRLSLLSIHNLDSNSKLSIRLLNCSDIVSKYETIPEDKVLHRALNQLARENLLLQSSDWPFLITTWQAKDYATDRFNEHVDRFSFIADMIESGNIDEAKLAEIESIDNCFPVIDYRVYLPIEEGVIPQQEAKLAPLYK